MLVASLTLMFAVCIPSDNGQQSDPPPANNDPKASEVSIGYKCVGSDATYYVFVNSSKSRKAYFSNTDGLTISQVVADQDTAGTEYITNPKGVVIDGGEIVLEAVTSVIFKK